MTTVYWIHHKAHTDIKTQGYVGVTKSLKERYWDHKKQAKAGTHPNPHLANAINLYKADILHTLIFAGPSEGCYQIEEYFRPSENTGWNLAKGGLPSSRMENKKHSEATKKRMSDTRKGIPKSEEHKQNIGKANKGKPGFPGATNPRARAIQCIETGEVFSTIKEAAEKIKRTDTAIIAYLSGRTSHCAGFTWKYIII